METNTCEFLDKKLTQILNLDVFGSEIISLFFWLFVFKVFDL